MAQLHAKPGSRKSLKQLERAFSKKLTIEDEDEDKDQEIHMEVKINLSAWDNLRLPNYPGDFEQVFFEIGFVGFLKCLEQRNKNILLPLHIAALKWKEVIEKKHAEWKADDICAAEKKDRLAQALASANEMSYETYRMDNMTDAEKEANAERLAASAKQAGEGPSRRRRKAANKRNNDRFLGTGGSTPGSALTQNMGVQKNYSKRPEGESRRKPRMTKRERDAQKGLITSGPQFKVTAPGLHAIDKGPITSRLRSMVTAPDLPPIEQELEALAIGGRPNPPARDPDMDVAMEL